MEVLKLNKILKSDNKRILYLLLFLLLGVILMLYPVNGIDTSEMKEYSHSIEQEEARLRDILSSIEGVGPCKVLLSAEKYTDEANLSSKSIFIASESNMQDDCYLYYGAVIVAGGSENAQVRYDILSSVMAYTGLGVDRITICPIQE